LARGNRRLTTFAVEHSAVVFKLLVPSNW